MSRWVLRLLFGTFLSTSLLAQGGGARLFTSSADVGSPAIAGATVYDAVSSEYRLTGSGANMWAAQDQFQYAWREMVGDFTATATLRFLGTGNEHRKAGLVLRQSLDTDSAYADVVVHGNGMPALQWRPRKGENTNTFDLPIQGPGTFTVKMVRAGVKVHLYVGRNGIEPIRIVNTEVTLTGPVLLGLAVCAHDATRTETVIFSNVSVAQTAPTPRPQ